MTFQEATKLCEEQKKQIYQELRKAQFVYECYARFKEPGGELIDSTCDKWVKHLSPNKPLATVNVEGTVIQTQVCGEGEVTNKIVHHLHVKNTRAGGDLVVFKVNPYNVGVILLAIASTYE